MQMQIQFSILTSDISTALLQFNEQFHFHSYPILNQYTLSNSFYFFIYEDI
jgi:hypothetical protein